MPCMLKAVCHYLYLKVLLFLPAGTIVDEKMESPRVSMQSTPRSPVSGVKAANPESGKVLASVLAVSSQTCCASDGKKAPQRKDCSRRDLDVCIAVPAFCSNFTLLQRVDRLKLSTIGKRDVNIISEQV